MWFVASCTKYHLVNDNHAQDIVQNALFLKDVIPKPNLNLYFAYI